MVVNKDKTKASRQDIVISKSRQKESSEKERVSIKSQIHLVFSEAGKIRDLDLRSR